jgi:hypothetical protein
MAKHMWGYVLAVERWATLLRRGGVLVDKALHSIMPQRTSTYAGKDWVIELPEVFPKPRSEHGCSVLAKRGATLLSSFPLAAQMCARSQGNVAAAEPDQFRDSESGLDGYQEKCAVSTASPGRAVWSCEQGVDFLWVEEVDRSLLEALAWHGQDPLADECVCRFVESDVSEEGVDRGQAGIAGAGAILSIPLQVLEKLSHEWGVQIFDRQVRRRLAESFPCKPYKQAKSTAVAGNSMSACAPLLE